MIILQVSMQEMNKAQVAELTRRFGRFFDADDAMVQYPVTCDSHGLDVFEDDFNAPGVIHEGRVYGAWLIDLHDGFTADDLPMDDEGSGTCLAEWQPVLGWDFHPASD